MVNGKILKFFIIFLVIISFAFGQNIFAYDDKIAHPSIAKMAVETFNKQNNNILSDYDIRLIMQGAREEDTPIRWMNHFYDPVYNEGLFFLDKQYQTSKNWVTNSEDQATYGKGDRSWYRAIADYKAGNREEALKELGHIVHLVSDLGVPAHTRNDPHADENSYEDFVKNNWQYIYDGLDKNFIPKELNNLDQAFDELANYSNNNFYSLDTFESPKYKIIEVTGYEKLGKYLIAKNDDIFLFKINENVNFINDTTKEFNNNTIHNNNAKHLVPKSIEYSAGVIKLFFDEVNKEQNVSLSSNRLKLFTANKFVGSMIGGSLAMGDFVSDSWNTAKYVGQSVGTAVAEGQTQIKSAYNEAVNSVQNNLSKITFDQILATIPNFRVVALPQTVNPAPVLSLPSIQIPEETQNITEPVEEILPPSVQLPKLELPKLTEPKKEEYPSGPQFVFGPGGEKNLPVVEVVPVVVMETEIVQATTTEDVISDPDGSASGGETTTTTSTSAEVTADKEEIIIDTEAPVVSSLDVSFVISTSTTTSSTVDISWQSIADDLVGYDLDFKKDDSDWANIFTLTTSTAYKMDAEKFKTYAFRVNATDTSTNTSAWSEKSIVIDYPKSVVINEIAWMGTASNKSSDEWLELYNNTDEDINLTGWKIKVSGNYLTWNNASSTIKAHDYYLLERTNDKAVGEILADGIFTISNGLRNTGENLILLNSDGETIDQVDNTAKWFAGEIGAIYKTMERISPTNPGTQASNWQTSDMFSVKGRVDGSTTRIYGTPRQPNKGYWYLQNLTTNYIFDENNTLTLTEENSPYFMAAQTEIPAGYTLKLKEGVVIAGVDSSSYFKVKGNLIIEGTVLKPVVFTSARDKNYVNYNFTDLIGDSPKSGDWSRIEVSENGKINASNVKFLYGGHDYFKQGGFMFGGKWPARVINNLGGEVNLDYATFQNNFTHTDEEDKAYDALIWLEPANGFFTTTTVNNSVFDGGHLAIKNPKQNNYLSITNSSFANFTYKYGPVVSMYSLEKFSNNVFENNVLDMVFINRLEVKKDMILDSNVEYLVSFIIVDVGATLQILPGTIINFLSGGGILVNGSLEAIGTEDNKIIIKPTNIREIWGDAVWGEIIFINSTSTLKYVDLFRGNYGSKKEGMLWMKNSNVILNNVSLTDAVRTGEMIYSKDSNLKMTDSEISWSKPKKSNDPIIAGINLDGGSLYLNNTTFNQMDRGINMYSFSTVEMENMTLGHFTNISDLNWWPLNAFEL